MTKLKQLLMKNKKELSEGKRREEELQTTVSALQGLLEEEKQGSEQAKVEVSQVMAKIQSMKQKVRLENGVSALRVYRASSCIFKKLTQSFALLTHFHVIYSHDCSM